MGTLPPVLDLTISHKVIAVVTGLFLRQLARVKRNTINRLLEDELHNYKNGKRIELWGCLQCYRLIWQMPTGQMERVTRSGLKNQNQLTRLNQWKKLSSFLPMASTTATMSRATPAPIIEMTMVNRRPNFSMPTQEMRQPGTKIHGSGVPYSPRGLVKPIVKPLHVFSSMFVPDGHLTDTLLE